MPNRIVREGINDSEVIDRLDYPAEVFYRRLLNAMDDFGRFDGRPSIVRSSLYKLRLDRVREADCIRWMAECRTAGAVALYETDGKPFLVVLKVDRPRAKRSKYPQPPEGIVCWRGAGDDPELCAHVRADEGVCAQVRPYAHSISDSISSSRSLSARAQNGVPKTSDKARRALALTKGKR